MYNIALFEAKNKLTRIVRGVEKGDPVELTRHGKSVAVIIGIERYNELKNSARNFAFSLSRFREEWPAENANEEPADPFAGIRGSEPGREVNL